MYSPRNKRFNLSLLRMIYQEATDILSPSRYSSSIYLPAIASTDVIDTAKIDVVLEQNIILFLYIEHERRLTEVYLRLIIRLLTRREVVR